MSSRIVVKGYQVGRQIDQAGMRTVYRARKLSNGKPVFVTVVSVRQGRSQRQLARRARQSQKLTVPEIVSAIDYGMAGENQFFYSHEELPSFPLSSVLAEVPSIDRRFALVRYMLMAAHALDYIHRTGTTHRDLSTPNLRVVGGDKILMEGFINARPKMEARNLVNIVNMPYMAPELFTGISVDPRSDIYSLGVIMYELLSGNVPYESNYTKLEAARDGMVPSLTEMLTDLPSGLDSIIIKCLSPRKDRYRAVPYLIQDLEAVYSRRPLMRKLRDLSSSLRQIFGRSRSA